MAFRIGATSTRSVTIAVLVPTTRPDALASSLRPAGNTAPTLASALRAAFASAGADRLHRGGGKQRRRKGRPGQQHTPAPAPPADRRARGRQRLDVAIDRAQ